MADTMDRRSEGKACDSESRDRYKRLEAQGLCAYCGKTPVKNRTTCYDCSSKSSGYTQRHHVRKSLAVHSIDPNLDVSRLDEMEHAAWVAVNNTYTTGELAKAEEHLKFVQGLRQFFIDNMRRV